ncbi:MAG: cupredoxin domain-containing protein, partial [Stellaceae bacterium]
GAAAAACAGGAGAATAETVELVMTEYRFSPDRLLFQHGLPYRLVLVNRGAELHELTAPEFFASIALDNPDSLAQGGKEVVLRPGERQELRFVALRPGRYPMSCADHDWAGMVGEIVVA